MSRAPARPPAGGGCRCRLAALSFKHLLSFIRLGVLLFFQSVVVCYDKTNFEKMHKRVCFVMFPPQIISSTAVYPFTRFFTRCHRHRSVAVVLAVLRFVWIIRHAPEWQLRSTEPLGRTRESVVDLRSCLYFFHIGIFRSRQNRVFRTNFD